MPPASHEAASAESDRPGSGRSAVEVDDEPADAKSPRPFGSGSGSGSNLSGDVRLLLSLRMSGWGGTGWNALKGSGSLSPERGDLDLDLVVRPLRDVVLGKEVGQCRRARREVSERWSDQALRYQCGSRSAQLSPKIVVDLVQNRMASGDLNSRA